MGFKKKLYRYRPGSEPPIEVQTKRNRTKPVPCDPAASSMACDSFSPIRPWGTSWDAKHMATAYSLRCVSLPFLALLPFLPASTQCVRNNAIARVLTKPCSLPASNRDRVWSQASGKAITAEQPPEFVTEPADERAKLRMLAKVVRF